MNKITGGVGGKFTLVWGCIWIFVSVLLAVATHSLAAQEVKKWQPKHAFSASIVEFNKHANKIQNKSRLILGKAGFRMETAGIPGQLPPIVYLQNFESDLSWMMTTVGERYVAMPGDDDSEDIEGGLMSTRACMGQTAKRSESRKWQGLDITVWQCMEGNRPVSIQYFSTELGIVIRDEKDDGQVKEMRNIQRFEPDADDFLPPKGYKNVNLREFFTGVPGLPVYQD